jgi:hypothetical protein
MSTNSKPFNPGHPPIESEEGIEVTDVSKAELLARIERLERQQRLREAEFIMAAREPAAKERNERAKTLEEEPATADELNSAWSLMKASDEQKKPKPVVPLATVQPHNIDDDLHQRELALNIMVVFFWVVVVGGIAGLFSRSGGWMVIGFLSLFGSIFFFGWIDSEGKRLKLDKRMRQKAIERGYR